jgi:hypothetical protein
MVIEDTAGEVVVKLQLVPKLTVYDCILAQRVHDLPQLTKLIYIHQLIMKIQVRTIHGHIKFEWLIVMKFLLRTIYVVDVRRAINAIVEDVRLHDDRCQIVAHHRQERTLERNLYRSQVVFVQIARLVGIYHSGIYTSCHRPRGA